MTLGTAGGAGLPGRQRRQRPGNRAGCGVVVLLLVLLLGGAVWLGRGVSATPDLGPAPAGPSHGTTEAQIAQSTAVRILAQLAVGSHAEVVLSEADLSVVARARNPDRQRFRNPHVRIRDGRLLIDAQFDLGPRITTLSSDLAVTLDTAAGAARLVTTIQDLYVGTVAVPEWARGFLDTRLSQALDVGSVFDSDPRLAPLRASLECVALTGQGLVVGLHRPGATSDPAACAPTG